METRKEIIENLKRHEEVENVLAVYIDEKSNIVDDDGQHLRFVDIVIITRNANLWGNNDFRNNVFRNCKLNETIQYQYRCITRQEWD